jgi:hypothetical protein
MVEGLNQLGAASGKNLGTLAKRMSEISDGAVNMKESMAAVAQGNAAGLTSQQMERMTKIAKTASQALGRDMGDALSRLSRGITKIEPELLDELGIMVKVDRAARDYAITLGKTATQLTEFEKRQSFAIAVLEQGEKKFGSINIDANPYQKLLATFTNLAIAGGQLINKVLGPIAKILGESPVALGAAMAGIAGMLLSKAIPALSQWRGGLAAAADEAEARAKRINTSLAEFKSNKYGVEAAEYDKVAEASRVKAVQLMEENKLFGKKSATFYAIAGGAKDLGLAAAETGKKLSAIDTAITNMSAKVQQSSGAEKLANEAALKSLNDKRLAYIALQGEIRAVTAAQQAAEAAEGRSDAPDRELDLRQRNADRLTRRAGSRRISNSVVENAETGGIKYAWKEIGADIARHNAAVGEGGARIGMLGAAYIRLGAAARLAMVGVELLSAAINQIFMVIAIGAIALAGLDKLFSKNGKAAEEFSEDLKTLDSAAEGAQRTLSFIAEKDPLERIGVESISAKAQAFNELSDSINKTGKSFAKTLDEASGWDKAKDWVKGLFGGSAKNDIAKSLSKSLTEGIKLIDSSDVKDRLNSKLTKAGLDPKLLLGDPKLLEAALNDLMDKAPEAAKQIGKAWQEASNDINNPISKIKSGFESLTAATKEYDTYVNSLAVSDPVAKIAQTSAKGFQELVTGITTAEEGMASLTKIISDTGTLKLLPEGEQQKLLAMRPAIEEIANLEKKYSEDKAKFQKEEAKLRDEINYAMQAGEGITEEQSRQMSLYGTAIIGVTNRIKDLKTEQEKLKESLKASLLEGIRASLVEMEAGMERAKAKASLGLSKAILSGAEGTEAVKARGAIAQQEIGIEQQAIDSRFKLLLSQEGLKLSNERLIAVNQLALKLKDNPDALKPGQEDPTAKKLVDLIDSLKVSEGKLKAVQAGTADGKSLKGDDNLSGAQGALMARDEQKYAAALKSQEASLTNQREIRAEALKQTQKSLALKKEELDNEAKRLDFLIKEEGIYANKSISAKLAIDAQQRDLEISKLATEQVAEAAKFEELISRSKGNKKLIAQQEGLKAQSNKGFDEKIEQARFAYIEKAGAAAEVAFTNEAKIASIKDQNSLKDKTNLENLTQAQESNATSQLDRLKELGAITELEHVKSLNRIEAEASQRKQALELEKQALADKEAQTGVQGKISNIDASIQAAKDSSEPNTALIDDLNASRQKQVDLLVALVLQQNAVRDSTIAVNDATNAGADAAAKYKEEMAGISALLKDTEEFGRSLSAVFGDVGDSIADGLSKGVKALTDFTSKQEGLDKNLIDQKLKALKEYGADTKEFYEADAKIEKKYQKDSLKNQLDVIGTGAGAFKKMFSEKTVAYKVLDGIEKTMHMAKMAMMVVEFTKEISLLGSKISAIIAGGTAEVAVEGAVTAAHAASIPVKTAAGAASMFSTMGPLGFAAVAAMLAIMSSLGGGSSASVSIPTGITAEERQEKQGTGSVLGDSTAKSDSIRSGIEILAEHSFEMLDYNQSMLRALRSVDVNIAEMAGGIARSTNILSKTSSFGTVEGKSGGGGGGLASLIFGSSSSSTEIVDKGLIIKGTSSAIKNVTAIVNEYETVATHWQDSGFLGFGADSGTSISENIKKVTGEVPKQLSLVFKEMDTSISEGLSTLGYTIQAIDPIMKSLEDVPIDLRVSLQGLKGDEIADALQGVFSKAFDSLITKATPWIEAFQQVGEGLGETFIRLAGQLRTVTLSFEQAGINFLDSQELLDKYNRGERVLGFLNPKTPQFGPTIANPVVNSASIGLAQDKVASAKSKLDGIIKDKVDSYLVKDLVSQGSADSDPVYNTRAATTKEKEAYKEVLANNMLTSSSKEVQSAAKELADAEKELADATRTGANDAEAFVYQVIKLQDSLVKGAGGLESFTEKMEFYTDNFLTETEKLDPVRFRLFNTFQDTRAASGKDNALGDAIPGLGKQLKDFGLQVPKTKAEFKSAFTTVSESLSTTGQAGIDLLNSLLDVMPAFEAVASAEEARAQLLFDTNVAIQEVSGGMLDQFQAQEALTTSTRANILATEDLSSANIAAYESLWKLEDGAKKAELFGISISGMQDNIMDSFKDGKNVGKELGTYLADSLSIGLANTFASQVGSIIMNTVVTPLMKNVVIGEGVVKLASNISVAGMITTAQEQITKLSTVFKTLLSSPEWKNLIASLSSGFNIDMPDFGVRDIQLRKDAEKDSKKDAEDSAKKLADILKQLAEDTKKAERELARLGLSTWERQQAEVNDKVEDYTAKLLEVGATLEQVTSSTSTYAAAQLALYKAQNKRAADNKVTEITDRIFEITSTAAQKALVDIDKQTAAFTKFFEDIGQLTSETEKLIGTFRKALVAQQQLALNNQKLTLEQRIYNLTGRESQANAISREQELSGTSEQFKPILEYIYALEDAKEIQEKLNDTYTESVKVLRDNVKALRDYKKSLLLSDSSTLTPTQKYGEAKSQYEATVIAALTRGSTEAEKTAQQAAIDKLPEVSDKFLEASRGLFASSAQYTQDFNSVLQMLDSTAISLSAQADVEQLQLDALGIIATNTQTTAQLTAQLGIAMDAVKNTLGAAIAAGSGAAGGSYTQPNIYNDLVSGLYKDTLGRKGESTGMDYWMGQLSSGALDTTTITKAFNNEAYKEIVNDLYYKGLGRAPEQAGYDYWLTQLQTGAVGLSNIKGVFAHSASQNGEVFRQYARGGLASGMSLVGEEGPELVDFATPARVYPAGQTMGMLSTNNTELLQELKYLREEVKRMREEQIKHTGSLITSTYDSSNRMAEAVAEAVDTAVSEVVWADRSKVRMV